ncbi:MAG: TonB family protein [Rikenellaceae bacterium]
MGENLEDKERIELPFEQRRFDLGLWVYNHQIGIFVTLGVYLIFIVALLFVQIRVVNSRKVESIAIELTSIVELQEQRDKLQEFLDQIEKERIEMDVVDNRVSNENVESENPDEVHQNIQSMLDEAAELKRQMEANRASYEQGLAELAEFKSQTEKQLSQVDTTRKTRNDTKVLGNVTVSYSLINPIRHATRLEVPAYLCQSGGEVKISITVERSGLVSAAKIVKSANDECIDEAALYAALRTEFDISRVAPVRHTGHITYIFVPQ